MSAARRVPVPESGNINEVWGDMKPGDYCGPIHGYTADCAAVFYIAPAEANHADHPCLGSLSHVCEPPHKFRECPDGSLEIRESIGQYCGCGSPGEAGGFAWHGYLDEGNVWRTV